MSNFFDKLIKGGRCKYCGEKTWFFKTSHGKCAHYSMEGWNEMVALVAKIASQGGDVNKLDKQIVKLANAHQIAKANIKNVVIEGWEKALKNILQDSIITEEAEKNLTMVGEQFSLNQYDLDSHRSYTCFMQGCILREILNGKIPINRIKTNAPIPFNLQKSEVMVWIFTNTLYYEDKTRTETYRRYVGKSKGFSVRIMKGVYYRTGAFSGYPIVSKNTYTQREHIDTGLLGITSKNIYFLGSKKSFKIPYKKIVSFIPHSDGIALFRDAANAKPQMFKTGDGWFTFNLVSNLAQIGN